MGLADDLSDLLDVFTLKSQTLLEIKICGTGPLQDGRNKVKAAELQPAGMWPASQLWESVPRTAGTSRGSASSRVPSVLRQELPTAFLARTMASSRDACIQALQELQAAVECGPHWTLLTAQSTCMACKPVQPAEHKQGQIVTSSTCPAFCTMETSACRKPGVASASQLRKDCSATTLSDP